MTKHSQTAADLDNCYGEDAQAYGEQAAAIVLAIFIGVGIACLLAAWWSA